MSYLPTAIEQGLQPTEVEQIYKSDIEETVTYMKYLHSNGKCAIRKIVQQNVIVEGNTVSTTKEYFPYRGQMDFLYEWNLRTTYNYVERIV